MTDPIAKKAMESLLANINQDDPFSLSEGTLPSKRNAEGNAVSSRVAVSSEGQQAMKDILSRLNEGMIETSDRLVETSKTYPQLAEALVTEQTSRGARIGSWEIVKHSVEDFDIVHTGTGQPIAKGLRLYEAAYALAKALNSGRTLTDEPVRRVLKLEETYSAQLDRAKHFKHMAKKMAEAGEPARAAIAEDRLGDARDKADEDYDRILKLAGL